MTDQKTLTAGDVVKAISASPEDFLDINSDNPRGSKTSANKYMDCKLKIDGKTKKLNFSWKGQLLRGGIKEPDDRRYGPTIQFRGSSGDLGKATVEIYNRFKSIIGAKLEDKSIKSRGSKAIVRSIVQTELENGEQLDDPIIRFKLPFKDGKQLFRLLRIEQDKDGNPRSVEIKCTEENVHTVIKNGILTSGFVTMDTVVSSGFGWSIPAKVQLLVIKPVENSAPSVESILSREEMLEMVGDVQDAGVEQIITEDFNDTEGGSTIDKGDSSNIENQLEALRQLALDEEDHKNNED